MRVKIFPFWFCSFPQNRHFVTVLDYSWIELSLAMHNIRIYTKISDHFPKCWGVLEQMHKHGEICTVVFGNQCHSSGFIPWKRPFAAADMLILWYEFFIFLLWLLSSSSESTSSLKTTVFWIDLRSKLTTKTNAFFPISLLQCYEGSRNLTVLCILRIAPFDKSKNLIFYLRL